MRNIQIEYYKNIMIKYIIKKPFFIYEHRFHVACLVHISLLFEIFLQYFVVEIVFPVHCCTVFFIYLYEYRSIKCQTLSFVSTDFLRTNKNYISKV